MFKRDDRILVLCSESNHETFSVPDVDSLVLSSLPVYFLDKTCSHRAIITKDTWDDLLKVARPAAINICTFAQFVAFLEKNAPFYRLSAICDYVMVGAYTYTGIVAYELCNSGEVVAYIYRWPRWIAFFRYLALLEIKTGWSWIGWLYTPFGLPRHVFLYGMWFRGWRMRC